MQVPSDRSTRWPASTSRPPNVMHGAGNSRLSRWHGTAAYGPGPSGRNSSADLPMGSGCPLRAQRLYSSTVDLSTDAGTPILSARRRSDGAILRLTNRLTDPKSRVKTMWLALPSSSWPSGRLWSGGAACTTAPRLGASRSGWAAPFRTSGTARATPLDSAHLGPSPDPSSSHRAKLRTWSATDRLGSSGTPEMRGSDARDSKHPTFGGQKCAPPNRHGHPAPKCHV